ncbi:hypothetical protein SBA4_2590003 [Candidatus Sulfopaludibacter sp. SbA4]|nr:hypothetical protein SBA4_2590003 [Candidatus Sulfopaludibacter sp. SbA4]
MWGRCHSAKRESVNYRGAPFRHRDCYDLDMLPTIAAAAGCVSIFKSVQQQPGLRLAQGKGPVKFLVIDRWRDSPRTD